MVNLSPIVKMLGIHSSYDDYCDFCNQVLYSFTPRRDDRKLVYGTNSEHLCCINNLLMSTTCQ